jgi:PAS domain S-box-containing protein
MATRKITRRTHPAVPSQRMPDPAMEALLNTSDVGFAIVDENDCFVRTNKGLRQLVEYPEGELVGLPFDRIIEARKVVKGPAHTAECRVVSKTGHIIDMVISSTSYRSAGGKRFTLKTFRNISREKELTELVKGAASSLNIGSIDYNLLTGEVIWTEATARILETGVRFKPTLQTLGRFASASEQRKIIDAFVELRRSMSDVEVEFRIRTANHKQRWVHLRMHPVLIKRKLAGIRMTALEIERLSWVARHTKSAVIIADKRDRIEWVNEGFSALFGYSPDEVRGKIPGTLLQGHLTDKKVLQGIREKVAAFQSVNEVVQLYTRDGKPIWINVDIAPIRLEDEPLYLVGILTDLTELMRAQEFQKNQEALEQRQKLLNAIAGNFPEGIIGVLNKNLQYVFVGGSEIERLGHSTQDWVGHALFDRVSPEANAVAIPHLQRVFQGESVQFEVSIKAKTYVVSAVPMAPEDKFIVRALVVIQNITERKMAEEETLRALTKQRELNELKTKFVTIASHEFRTPLGTILSSADLAYQYHQLHDAENTSKHIHRIKTSVKQLTEILNEFLQLSKIEDGGTKDAPVEFKLTECCEGLVDEINTVKKADQQILFAHEGLDTVCLDRQHVRNILVNLLSNAIKYSPPGKRIWFSARADKTKVVFEVKDEGIGIPEGEQSQVYDPFFRAHNAGQIQGTGLGLNIVQRYLKLMKGTITMRSVVGKGTTFTVTLPQARVAETS